MNSIYYQHIVELFFHDDVCNKIFFWNFMIDNKLK